MKGYDLTMKELEEQEKLIEIENENEKADAQLQMTWVVLISMIIYPLVVILSSYFGLNGAVSALSGMAPTFFASCAGVLMAFFGAEAYKNKS